ncbi:hypothetical protein HK102_000249 [Quaeritorhiza haematococci]|nr:hypothetical protein HK102_000249 [Quaeritorhiza haematococci]
MSGKLTLQKFAPRSTVPLAILGTAGLSLWGYIYFRNVNNQKASTSLFKGLLFHIRHSPTTTSLLGSDVHYDKSFGSVSGTINHIKGEASISFPIKGEKGSAEVVYKGRRQNPDSWASDVFVVRSDKGEVFDMKALS